MLILLLGGELLVRYASRLAIAVGLSPLVVGLTVVALGTSSPELMSSIYAQWVGRGSLALGNVVGSNIFNSFLTLGASAAVTPLVVDEKVLRIEVPIVVGLSLLAWGVALSGTIAFWESAILLAAFVAYVAWVFYESRSRAADPPVEVEEGSEAVAPAERGWVLSAGLLLLGLVLVIVGGRMFISSAVDLAENFGVEESVIGLTIVAAGTSLPELVTSALASFRGHRDIAVGNVVGSNLFNLTLVLGSAGLVRGSALPLQESLLWFDLPVMLAAAIVVLPIARTAGRIERWEGGILVLYYLGYITYLVLRATARPAAHTFGRAMLWFVVPLTLLTAFVIWSQRRRT